MYYLISNKHLIYYSAYLNKLLDDCDFSFFSFDSFALDFENISPRLPVSLGFPSDSPCCCCCCCLACMDPKPTRGPPVSEDVPLSALFVSAISRLNRSKVLGEPYNGFALRTLMGDFIFSTWKSTSSSSALVMRMLLARPPAVAGNPLNGEVMVSNSSCSNG